MRVWPIHLSSWDSDESVEEKKKKNRNSYEFSSHSNDFRANQMALCKQMNARSKIFNILKRKLSFGGIVCFIFPHLDTLHLFLNAEGKLI